MTVYARSDIAGIHISEEVGGCGVRHDRPVVEVGGEMFQSPDFPLDCPACSAWIAERCQRGDGRRTLDGPLADQWTTVASRVPLTPDEQLAADQEYLGSNKDLVFLSRLLAASSQDGAQRSAGVYSGHSAAEQVVLDRARAEQAAKAAAGDPRATGLMASEARSMLDHLAVSGDPLLQQWAEGQLKAAGATPDVTKVAGPRGGPPVGSNADEQEPGVPASTFTQQAAAPPMSMDGVEPRFENLSDLVGRRAAGSAKVAGPGADAFLDAMRRSGAMGVERASEVAVGAGSAGVTDHAVQPSGASGPHHMGLAAGGAEGQQRRSPGATPSRGSSRMRTSGGPQ